MNNKNTIRWGMIGCGKVTERKSAPAYQATEKFKITAVAARMESKPRKLSEYASTHNIEKVFVDAKALIHDPEIDAVYIATPPDSHGYYAKLVCDAGKPCCVEKPLAPSYEESKAICEAFEAKHIPLFVAYYRRSLPRFLKIKQWLDEQRIGELRHINWLLRKPANDLDHSGQYLWRTDKNIAKGGYFDDIASHGLDLFTFLLGSIKSAYGIASNQQGLYSASDSVTACWLHENGIAGSGGWTFGSFERRDEVHICGSRGKICFSVFDEVPFRMEVNGETTEISIENPEHIQQYHVENMREHLLNDVKHPSLGESAVHTAWVMDRILLTPEASS